MKYLPIVLLAVTGLATQPFIGVEYTPSATPGGGAVGYPGLMLGATQTLTLDGLSYALDGWVTKWQPLWPGGWWGFAFRGSIALPWYPNVGVGGGVRFGVYWGNYSITNGYWTPFLTLDWAWRMFTLGVDFWLPHFYETSPLGRPYVCLWFRIALGSSE